MVSSKCLGIPNTSQLKLIVVVHAFNLINLQIEAAALCGSEASLIYTVKPCQEGDREEQEGKTVGQSLDKMLTAWLWGSDWVVWVLFSPVH